MLYEWIYKNCKAAASNSVRKIIWKGIVARDTTIWCN